METVGGTIKGTPCEVGVQVFERFVAPILPVLNEKPEKEKVQFYVGLISSCFGALVADVGYEKAVGVLSLLVAEISSAPLEEWTKKPNLKLVESKGAV